MSRGVNSPIKLVPPFMAPPQPYETNLDDSIDSGNFSVRGCLSLIREDSTTHMHGLAVYVKEGLPFPQDLSLENSADSYLCF